MKRLKYMLALAVGFGLLPAAALASPITLSLGWSTTLTGSVTTLATGSSPLTFNGSVNGWSVVVATGTTANPDNPLLDLSTTAQCGSCSSTLYLWLTGTGFTSTPAGVTSTVSTNNQGSSPSLTQTAWWDGGNTAFSTANLIGTLGPYSGVGALGGSVSGGGPSSSTYSLTLADSFASGSSNNYSSDGSLAVPEPASLALLGTGLLGLAFVFRRRLQGAPGLDA